MPPLSAAGPAGTTTDPFVGTPVGGFAVPEFDADLWREAGATDEELEYLAGAFEQLPVEGRRQIAGWSAESDAGELAEALEQWRSVQADLQAAQVQRQEAYDALPEQDRAVLEALSDEDRAALAELAAAGSEADGETVPDDGESPPETPPVNAPPIEGDPAPAVDPEADTKQLPDKSVTFAGGDIGDLTIKQVLEHVGDDKQLAAVAIEAEQAREDDARSSLLAHLRRITE